MNKIQYINLLKIRGVEELPNGETIGSMVESTGGEPSDKEMVLVNKMSMDYYIGKYTEQKELNVELVKELDRLRKREEILSALEGAGVDNWEGYDFAMEMLNTN